MARILIVDDSFVMRKKLKEILERLGHKVVSEASDGNQAIHAYEKCMPDLVTMDINMPNIDGIAAVKQITYINPNAKVVMISSLAQKMMVIEAMQNGAKNYVLKPIDENKLDSVINLVLSEKTPSTSTSSASTVPEEDTKTRIIPAEFIVDNKNGTFVITIKDSFNASCIMSLKNAIQGLIFIKPLKVVFDFQIKLLFDNKLFLELIEILSIIIKIEGSIQLVTPHKENVEVFSQNGMDYGIQYYEQEGQYQILI